MQNNKFIGLAIAAFVFCFATFAYGEKPNILMIYLDDFGWRDTGYMGSDFFETPNIDQLATSGMIFTDAYSCAANCAPARASLLSGQYTPRHQVFNVGTRPRGKAEFRRLDHVPGTDTLDPKIKTWAQQLQKAGYKTATMGKWHLSKDPLPYGFDVNIGGTHSGGPPKGYYPPHGNAPGLSEAPENEYLTDRLSAEAIQFIRDNQSDPWMLYLTHFAVHTPLNAKKELVQKYRDKKKGSLHNNVKMATMIEAVDTGIGEIRRTLDELNLAENTVIIFYSDNGGYGPATDMDPLKGYKGTYYEGGIRVPLCISWPGVIEAGQNSEEPVTGVDIYPTLIEMAQASMPDDQECDGVSLVPLLSGKTKSLNERALYWHFPAYLQSYASPVNEQRDPLFRSRPCSVIRDGDWKLLHFLENESIELYNLSDDIGETKNLRESNPEKADELFSKLKAWRIRLGAPIPKPSPYFDSEKEIEAIRKAKKKSRQSRGTNKEMP